MTSAPRDGAFPADLHYAEGEPVRLDVAAIVAAGDRIRLRRLAARATAAVLALAAVPAALTVTGALTLTPHGVAGPAIRFAGGRGQPASGSQNGPARAHGPVAGIGPNGVFGPVFGYGQRAVRTRIGATATLPQGYDPVTALVGDPVGPGAWFWGSTRTQVRVFRLSPAGSLRSWPVPGMPIEVAGGFAVTRAEVAWLALRSTVARLDTRTGQVRTWQVPAPRDNPASDRHRPPGLGHGYAAQALAVSPDGTVAVAEANSSSVQVLDPATGRFRQVMMPSKDDVPQAVGFSSDGALGIGYQHVGAPHYSGIMIVPAVGPAVAARVADSSGVVAFGAFDLLVGVGSPAVVTPAGRVRPVAAPVKQLGGTAWPQPLARLPGGRLAALAGPGIVAFPASARSMVRAQAQSVWYVPPVTRCLPEAVGGGDNGQSPSAAPASQGPCYLPVQLYAADARGDLWIVDGSGDAVDLLVPR